MDVTLFWGDFDHCFISRPLGLDASVATDIKILTVIYGFCHHSMVRPLVAVGGVTSNMEDSCQYIE